MCPHTTYDPTVTCVLILLYMILYVSGYHYIWKRSRWWWRWRTRELRPLRLCSTRSGESPHFRLSLNLSLNWYSRRRRRSLKESEKEKGGEGQGQEEGQGQTHIFFSILRVVCSSEVIPLDLSSRSFIILSRFIRSSVHTSSSPFPRTFSSSICPSGTKRVTQSSLTQWCICPMVQRDHPWWTTQNFWKFK
jgi:hypothetical protein